MWINNIIPQLLRYQGMIIKTLNNNITYALSVGMSIS